VTAKRTRHSQVLSTKAPGALIVAGLVSVTRVTLLQGAVFAYS